jgi:hypothetical protein
MAICKANDPVEVGWALVWDSCVHLSMTTKYVAGQAPGVNLISVGAVPVKMLIQAILAQSAQDRSRYHPR